MSFLSSMFGGGKSASVSQVVPQNRVATVTPDKDAAAKSANEELKKRQQRAASNGGRSTVLTTNDSLEGTPVGRKSLLGRSS